MVEAQDKAKVDEIKVDYFLQHVQVQVGFFERQRFLAILKKT